MGVSAPVRQFKISLGPGPPVISGSFLGLVFIHPHTLTHPLSLPPTLLTLLLFISLLSRFILPPFTPSLALLTHSFHKSPSLALLTDG